MSIQNTSLRSAGPFYGGGGPVLLCPVAWKVFAAEDILVTYSDPAGNASAKLLNIDYSVALNDDQENNPGGTVSYLAPQPPGSSVTLTSNQANTIDVNIASPGGAATNNGFDRVCIMVQQLAEQVSRAALLPLGAGTNWPALSSQLLNAAAQAQTAAGQAQAAAAASQQSFRNKLVNGCFRLDQWNNFAPVLMAGPGYVCDRWLLGSLAGGPVTCQNFNGALQIAPSNAATLASVQQRVESRNCQELAGAVVTVSGQVWVDALLNASQAISVNLACAAGGDVFAGETALAAQTLALPAAQIWTPFSAVFSLPPAAS